MNTHSKLSYPENFGTVKALFKDEKQKLDGLTVMQHVPKKQVLYFPAGSFNQFT